MTSNPPRERRHYDQDDVHPPFQWFKGIHPMKRLVKVFFPLPRIEKLNVSVFVGFSTIPARGTCQIAPREISHRVKTEVFSPRIRCFRGQPFRWPLRRLEPSMRIPVGSDGDRHSRNLL